MKRLLTFLSLIFVFSISLASANNTVISELGDSSVGLKQIHPADKVLARRNVHAALLPELLVITARYHVIAAPRFSSPTVNKSITLPDKIIPLIGKGNINCYGGTAARYARG